MSGSLINILFDDSERVFVRHYQRWRCDEFLEASSTN